MIKPFTVHALHYGEITADWSQLVYLYRCGEPLTFGVWGAAIEGQGYKILVDLGGFDPQVTNKVIAYQRSEDQTPVGALKKLGWRAEEVDLVLLTHLHWDHVGDTLRPFTKARLVLQGSEWAFAHAPIDPQTWAYFSFNKVCLDPNVEYFQWLFVEGEHEILPGLKLIPTPGHTPGHQSVLVKTDEGPLVICGDAVNIETNLIEHRPSGITQNAGEYMSSMAKVCRLGTRLIAAHELSLKDMQDRSFPLIPATDHA